MSFEDPLGQVARKPLHFIWLADCSGSMTGKKIQSLNQAVSNALPEVQDAQKSNVDAEILFRVLEFSTGARWSVPTPTPADQFRWKDLDADGITDLGAALKELTLELTADKMGKRNKPPVLVLLSDGAPTDDWESALTEFNATPWGKTNRTVRIAIAIGHDADKEVLAKFTGNPELVFEANNSHTLARLIKWASVTVSSRASTNPQQQTDDSGSGPVPVPIPKPDLSDVDDYDEDEWD